MDTVIVFVVKSVFLGSIIESGGLNADDRSVLRCARFLPLRIVALCAGRFFPIASAWDPQRELDSLTGSIPSIFKRGNAAVPFKGRLTLKATTL